MTGHQSENGLRILITGSRNWPDDETIDAGYVDLTMARGPLVVGAELKAEKGRLSDGQKGWEAVLRQAYEFRYDLWRPSDWDKIEQTLRRTT